MWALQLKSKTEYNTKGTLPVNLKGLLNEGTWLTSTKARTVGRQVGYGHGQAGRRAFGDDDLHLPWLVRGYFTEVRRAEPPLAKAEDEIQEQDSVCLYGAFDLNRSEPGRASEYKPDRCCVLVRCIIYIYSFTISPSGRAVTGMPFGL